jgi:VanZ family protein
MPAYAFLVAVIVFIVYGSLFPFDFASQALPIDRFYTEYKLFANRSDAIDNFLLFVPLGIGLHLSFRQPAARFAAATLSILVLAVGIQLIQLYLPSRTASVVDAFWNTAGMGAGLLVASRVGNAFRAQLSARTSGRDDFALCLVMLWFIFESFPFIPTLDIGELRAHVKSAIIAPPFEFMRLFQHALAATLAGIAVTRLGLLRRPVLGVTGLGALSMLLEVCVAYGSLRRETLLGIAAGLATGYVVAHRLQVRCHGVAFALALCACLLTVFTPYRGQALDAGFTLTPFSHLLWHGVVKEVPPCAFEALAIGALLWSGMAGPYRFRDRPHWWCAMVLLLLAGLEWVRVSLAGLHGDTTTLAMAAVLAPAAVALRVGAGTGATDRGSDDDVRAAAATPASGPVHRRALALFACSAASLTMGLWLLLQLPGIPYNLKHLFGDHVVTGAAVFSLALLWLGSGPWMVAHIVMGLDARRRHGAMWTPLLLAGVALVSFALVNFAVPDIMLDKIIGSPDLYRRIVDENYWGDAWRGALSPWPGGAFAAGERVVRYVALYSVFAIPLVAGLLALPRQGRRARVLANLLYLLPCWLLAKYVVLDWAITDNLTELVADGGAVFLAALIALFSVNVVALVAGARLPRTFPVLTILTAALVLATWWLLNQGIESMVINNGRLFSGVQFLLGENRSTLLSAPALLARWCALYCSGTAVVVIGTLLAMRLLPVPASPGRKLR